MHRDLGPTEFVGILPAAGIASRLSPSRYVKELLPVTYLVDEDNRTSAPVPVIVLSLRALRAADVTRCVVTISERKPELLRYLGDGSDFGLSLAYVQQPSPTGLTSAIKLGFDWTRDCYSCLLLPDTVIYPRTAMRSVRKLVERESCDLALGVFPTDVPEQLGPVRFDSDGRVRQVLDKPAATDLRNTWAMAIWSPRFASLLDQVVSSGGEGKALGEVFNLAVLEGMDVRAVWFPDGAFVDIGTVKGLAKMLQLAEVQDLSRIPDSNLLVDPEKESVASR
jgi:glucose-1-phosphate thymidylyltransferase